VRSASGLAGSVHGARGARVGTRMEGQAYLSPFNASKHVFVTREGTSTIRALACRGVSTEWTVPPPNLPQTRPPRLPNHHHQKSHPNPFPQLAEGIHFPQPTSAARCDPSPRHSDACFHPTGSRAPAPTATLPSARREQRMPMSTYPTGSRAPEATSTPPGAHT